MKKPTWIIIALFLGLNSPLYGQKPEIIVSPIVMEYDSVYYAHQAQAWKKEIDQHPENEEAWENYYNAIRYQYNWYRNPNQPEKEQEVLRQMQNAIPDSFIYNILFYIQEHNMKNAEYMRKAMAMRPADLRFYPDYIVFLLYAGSEEELRTHCKTWYDSGTYSENLLSYSYNEMANTPKNSVIFSDGDATIYPKLLLKYGKGIFSDKTIVGAPLLVLPEYRKKLCKELNIPELTECENSDDFIRHIVRHTNRPIYLSMSMAARTSLKDLFYSEGLLMKYSEEPYDNMAVTKYNFEQVYLKDYLYIHFSPEPYETSAQWLNLNYIFCLRPLLQFYKDSKDPENFKQLYQLMETILRHSTAKGPRKEHALKTFQEFSQ